MGMEFLSYKICTGNVLLPQPNKRTRLSALYVIFCPNVNQQFQSFNVIITFFFFFENDYTLLADTVSIAFFICFSGGGGVFCIKRNFKILFEYAPILKKIINLKKF